MIYCRYCLKRICTEGFFQCRNNRCVLASSQCNEVDDCGDFRYNLFDILSSLHFYHYNFTNISNNIFYSPKTLAMKSTVPHVRMINLASNANLVFVYLQLLNVI